MTTKETRMVPKASGALRKRFAPGHAGGDGPSPFAGGIAYVDFRVPTKYMRGKFAGPQPFAHAECVTTMLASPYLFGSPAQTEVGPEGDPVAYAQGFADGGRIELLAQLHGQDTSATLNADGRRVRKVAGLLLAGVYTVPPNSGASEVRIVAPVETRGTSVIYGEGNGLTGTAQIHLQASIDVLVLGTGAIILPTEDTSALAGLHGRTWGLAERTVWREINDDSTREALVSVSDGDILAIFLKAEAEIQVQDGRDIIAMLNTSADGSAIPGGAVHIPYVEVRLC